MHGPTINAVKRVVEVAPPPVDVVAIAPPSEPDMRRIGTGRSAIVYRVRQDDDVWARKVFEGDPLAKLVHLVLNGAPNPYTWNGDAIAAAVSRRRLLASLVRFWFDDGRLRLPALRTAAWNPVTRTWQIDMEFIAGRAAALHHHAPTGREDELTELTSEIMRPLQRHLRVAGFDGLVWQAGLGNPVAASNFLLDEPAGDTRRWVWVDLESGVPALFPLDPITLFTFYLPRSIRHRGPLFDDVDTTTLFAYLDGRRVAIDDRLGAGETDRLLAEADTLAAVQRRWKDLSRLHGSIEYAERREHISETQARYYRSRPLRWYSRLTRRAITRAPSVMGRIVRRVWRRIIPRSLVNTGRAAARFLFSQRRRTRWAAHMIRTRIRRWEQRRQLAPNEARDLIAHVRSDEATAYLTDFAMHVAIKAPVKAIEWFILPALFAAGLIDQTVLLIGLATGGVIGRTAYTLGRLVQASTRGEERPWVALATGLLPIVGNAAYPLQILYTSAERDHDVAKFILIDLVTAMGRKVPIWGGPDTRTEHAFNRVPVRFLAQFGPRRRSA